MKEQNQDEGTIKIEQLKKDYLNTFSSEHGKRVLADLENKCFINKTTFSQEGLTLAFHEGQRFMVVNIKNMMNFSIEKLKQLIEEEK